MSRQNKFFLSSQLTEDPAVNLTPLIDVVFVILIMFIVIAPLLQLDNVELASASSHPLLGSSVNVQEASMITIHVYQDNTIIFNDRPTNTKELSDLLKQAKIKYPKAIPQLLHDKRAQFGTYQAVKNAAEDAGFQQLEIILKPS